MTIAKPHRVPAEEAFLVTVGVPSGKDRNTYCHRALKVLEQAGFRVGATGDAAIFELASRIELANKIEKSTEDQ